MNRRHSNWALYTALTLFLLLGFCCLAASGPNAKTLYARGQAAESKDDPITAYDDYYQAYEKEPKNLRYKTAYERLRFQAGSAHVKKGEALAAQGDVSAALTEYLRAIEIDPSNEMAHQDIGVRVLERIRADMDVQTKVEQMPRMENRQMVMVLTPR